VLKNERGEVKVLIELGKMGRYEKGFAPNRGLMRRF